MKTSKKGALVCAAALTMMVGAVSQRSNAGPMPDISAEGNGEAVASKKAFSLECKDGSKSKPKARTKEQKEHDAAIRRSAQKGLDFLTEATLQWQNQNKCMGCHVQGVAAEALSVGKHHQYTVQPKQMKAIYGGLLDLSGGARTNEGHAAKGGALRASTRAFAGASIARYDRWVGDEYGDDLLSVANDLLEHQNKAGAIHQAYNHGVAKGPLQGTFQAIQTWRQAYARTADDRWLTATARGESFIQAQIDSWYKHPTADLQHVNYAMLGLLAAGVGSTEKVVMDLQKRLLSAQNDDGGFPLAFGGGSSALATGQTLYTLRRLGMNDSDEVIRKATEYVIEHQQADGGWSDSGGEKAEAMWAVLGLVSTDVLSVNVTGVKNGQHISSLTELIATAKDNEGDEVSRIDISVDDIAVGGACGDKAKHALKPKELESGMHTIDVVATNDQGKQASRRLVVYAGDHYITDMGNTFEDNGTLLSMRNIAPESFKHTIELTILDEKGKKTLHKTTQPGVQGAVYYHWAGDLDGKEDTATRGDYKARWVVRDAKGKVRHERTFPFVHDTNEVQANKYSQVSGKINFADDGADVQNAEIDLIDEDGNVVQSVTSTSSGSYRFRNVKSKKKYKVRVRKKGKKAQTRELAPAAPAAEEAMDFSL